MKMVGGRTRAGRVERRNTRNGVSAVLAFWMVLLFLTAGCQFGTGDVELNIDPDSVKTRNMDFRFLTSFQVSATDIVTKATVANYPVEIAMDMAEGCGDPVYSMFFTLLDGNKQPVSCPWNTRTDDNGVVRFYVQFNGTWIFCLDYLYTVSVFGDDGPFASTTVENSCS